MADVELLYKFLAREANAQSDAALAGALRTAEPDYAARIIRALLSRATETAWAGLIEHADLLSPGQEHELLTRPDLIAKGVGPALQRTDHAGPRGALRALRLCPVLEVAPLVAEVLGGPSEELQADAADLLRSWAKLLLLDSDPTRETQNVPPSTDERAAVVRGLARALVTFERHRRAEVLEAALWFAVELGPVLWSCLQPQNATAAALVASHLFEWNRPRIAGFLLLALAQPRWREAALTILGRWTTPAELSAILAHTFLLKDPAIASALSSLHEPVWLSGVSPELRELPREQRWLVPFWVAMLGLPEKERLNRLQGWLVTGDAALKRASLQALALMDSSAATQTIARAAQHGGGLARFARWYVIGRAAAERPAQPREPAVALAAARSAP